MNFYSNVLTERRQLCKLTAHSNMKRSREKAIIWAGRATTVLILLCASLFHRRYRQNAMDGPGFEFASSVSLAAKFVRKEMPSSARCVRLHSTDHPRRGTPRGHEIRFVG